MESCIRCQEELAQPEAQYCGNCGFPILNDQSEKEVRETAQDDLRGFLEGPDVKSILDSINGDQELPAEPYQWYLEEAVKKALIDFAILQRWDGFDESSVSGLFFQKELFEEDAPDEAVNDLILWARIWAFFYEALQPSGLEFSIRMATVFVEEINSVEDIDVSITVKSTDEDESPAGAES
jgi:hypothetical protein